MIFMLKKSPKKFHWRDQFTAIWERWGGQEFQMKIHVRGGNFERSAKIEEIRINNSSTPPASVQCLSKLEILSLLTLRWRGEGQEINFQGGKDGARWLLLLSLLSSSFTLSLGIFKFCRMLLWDTLGAAGFVGTMWDRSIGVLLVGGGGGDWGFS